MGKTFKQNFKRSKFEQERKVKKVICHPDHCKVPGYPRLNDIALIRVARSFNIIPSRVTNEYFNFRIDNFDHKSLRSNTLNSIEPLIKTVVEPIGIATIFDQLRSDTSCSVFGWGDTKDGLNLTFKK